MKLTQEQKAFLEFVEGNPKFSNQEKYLRMVVVNQYFKKLKEEVDNAKRSR